MGTGGGIIASVRPGSWAEQAGLRAGDVVRAVNGQHLQDVIDYRYLCADERVRLEVVRPDGAELLLEAEKDYGQDLGISFTAATFDGIRRCRNRCLFCFVDQMPGGLRPGLYVKDDDYRHSFLYGNYITLTGLREEDWRRIRRLRLSPLYISVHSTNPALRARLMGTPRAAPIMTRLAQLVEDGIHFHAQVVLCPGLNDGPELERTVRDLAGFYPAVESVAAVPVGLTAHREGLPPLRGYTGPEAGAVLAQVDALRTENLARLGEPLLYAADEFYVLAGRPIPPARYYGDFPQLENGVGMLRRFLDAAARAYRGLPRQVPPRRVAVATGLDAAPFLQRVGEEVARRVAGLEVRVVAVPNRFFGPRVTVAGLLTGGDLLEGLAGLREEVTEILVPASMLAAGEEELLLDGRTLSDVRARLGVPVRAVIPGGAEYVRALVSL